VKEFGRSKKKLFSVYAIDQEVKIFVDI